VLLEDSERLITYYTKLRSPQPDTGEVFSIDDGDVIEGTSYPLIAVRTGMYRISNHSSFYCI
jgi:hypothetical protein